MTEALRSPHKAVRVALVTGADRGIGIEICRQLAERDFVVLLSARDVAKARVAATKLEKVGTVVPLALDVAHAASIKPESITTLARRLKAQTSMARSWRRSLLICWGRGACARHFCHCCGRVEEGES